MAMRYLGGAVVLIVVLGAAAAAYVRLAPSDAARWHTDPAQAGAAQGNGWLVAPEGGNAVSPFHPQDPATLLDAIDRVALSTPRTIRLAGSVQEGRITYVTRSRLVGYPDYTTVTTLPAAGGSTLVIHARQRFGAQDMGVNRARVEDWLRRLAMTPGGQG